MFTDNKFMTALFLLILLVIVFSLFDLLYFDAKETRPSRFMIVAYFFNCIFVMLCVFALLCYFIAHVSEWWC